MNSMFIGLAWKTFGHADVSPICQLAWHW